MNEIIMLEENNRFDENVKGAKCHCSVAIVSIAQFASRNIQYQLRLNDIVRSGSNRIFYLCNFY